MKMRILAPTMEDGEEADLHTETLRVARDGDKRPGSGAKQDIVHGLFVVEGDAGDRFRDSEDNVEIFDRQQLGLALLEPMGTRQTLALLAQELESALGNAGCGKSGISRDCIRSGRTIRQHRPARACGRLGART